MFNFIEKNLLTISEDQNDFYSFALRKFSLIHFIEMVRFNENVIRKDFRYVDGMGHFLKEALVYLRHNEIQEAEILEKTKGFKNSQVKAFRKAINVENE